MKKLLSVVLSFSLFLSACSTLTDVASSGIDKAANAAGIPNIAGATDTVKKVIIPKDKEWDDDDASADSETLRNAPKSQDYLNRLLKKMQSYSNEPDYPFSIYILRTAKVQGLVAWGCDIKITRGMFNMIADEAEIACLMGHEIGHVASKDAQREELQDNNKVKAVDTAADVLLGDSKYKGIIRNQQKQLMTTNWSREAEKNADKYGAELAAKAGYDPYAFCDLFERLAGRIDLGLMYKFQKLEGSHPALDDRAKSLREYLQKKGYKEGVGKRNKQEYLNGMSEVHAIRTGDGKKEDKKIQKEIDEEGKKDLKRLDAILKEVENLKKSNNSISMKRFIEIMDEVSAICKKYGVTADDVFKDTNGSVNGKGSSFMEESIEQDSPFWEMFKSIKEAVAGKVGAILNSLRDSKILQTVLRVAPYTGDIIDVYELFSGKDFFTGEKLSAFEKALTALGLLIGSGSAWRNAAKAIEKEMTQMGIKDSKKIIDEAAENINVALKKGPIKNGSDIRVGTHTEARNLKESLAMKEAKSGQGKITELTNMEMKDPKYVGGDWKKMSSTHKSKDGSVIEIHYMKQTSTGKTEGYKIIDYGTIYKKPNGVTEIILK